MHENEGQYHKLLEISLNGIGIESEGKFVFMNPTGAGILGAHTPKDIIGRPVLDFVHKDYHQTVAESIKRIKSEEISLPISEQKYIRLDTSVIDVEVSKTFIKYNDKPSTQIVFRDISILKKIDSDNKEMEDALRKSEKRFRELAELLPEMVFEADKEGNITFANKVVYTTFGIDKDEETKKQLNIFNMLIPEERDILRENLSNLQHKDVLGVVEYTAQKTDKTKFPVIINANYIINDLGQPMGYKGVIINITERKHAQEVVEDSISLLRATFDSTVDGILVLDKNGKIQMFNRKLLEILDIKEPVENIQDGDKLFDMLFRNLKKPESLINRIRQLSAKTSKKDYDYIEFHNGRIFELYALSQHIGKKRAGHVWSFHEITDRVKAEQDIHRRLKFDETIAEVSSRFVGMSDFNEAVNLSLCDIGKFVEAGRVRLFLLSQNGDALVNTNSWIDRNIPDDQMQVGPYDIKEFSWMTNRLIKNETMFVESIDDLPSIADNIKKLIRQFNSEPFLCLPITISGKFNGVVFFAKIKKVKELKSGEIKLMHIFSEILGNALERSRAEEKMRSSLNEKDVLLKEIHHRVKNNLQLVSSMFNLQSTSVGNGQTKELFKESQMRIKSMALIHEKLYHAKDLAQIGFSEYAQSLIASLFRTYKSHSKAVSLRMDIKDVSLDIDTAIPCGLILNELVTNSLKHAFPSTKKGRIYVGIRSESIANDEKNPSDKKSKITLSVSDNGVGLPNNINLHKTKSLGLQLVSTLTDQLDATVRLSRKKGTSYRISFVKQ